MSSDVDDDTEPTQYEPEYVGTTLMTFRPGYIPQLDDMTTEVTIAVQAQLDRYSESLPLSLH